MEKDVTTASVYFRHGSWNHRYAKINDNGQKEYGSITGFKTLEEARESFWKYLNEYRKKLRELDNQRESLQENYEETTSDTSLEMNRSDMYE